MTPQLAVALGSRTLSLYLLFSAVLGLDAAMQTVFYSLRPDSVLPANWLARSVAAPFVGLMTAALIWLLAGSIARVTTRRLDEPKTTVTALSSHAVSFALTGLCLLSQSAFTAVQVLADLLLAERPMFPGALEAKLQPVQPVIVLLLQLTLGLGLLFRSYAFAAWLERMRSGPESQLD